MQEPINDPILPDNPRPIPMPPLLKWQDVVTVLVLALLISAGYWMRSTGRNWDDYTHLHPDERFLTDVASRVGVSPLNFPESEIAQMQKCLQRYPAPTDAELADMSDEEKQERLARVGRGGYFDAECSNLNPNNIGFGLYVYGQFPLFATRVTAETVTEIEKDQCLDGVADEATARDCTFYAQTSAWERYNGVHLIGRLVNSLADTLTILLVFMLGAKLVGRWQGLLAATLYTFAAFPIQLSHFWTVDAFTGFWVMLTLYMAANVQDDDANRPAAYNPLIWIAAAFGVWVWELPHAQQATLYPFVIYGVAFAAVGITGTWAHQRRSPLYILGGLLAGFLILSLAMATELTTDRKLAQEIFTPYGAGGALLGMIVIAGISYAGANRWLAFGGTIPWLIAPYGIWIYDSLAHVSRPSLTSLALYLIIFTASALLASILSRTAKTGERIFWLVLIGVPLLIWAILDAGLGALPWEGMIAAVILAGMMIAATASGYRDYMSFGLALGASLSGRVNIAPVVGVLFLAVIIRTLPIMDRRIFPAERYRLLTRAMLGVMVAGVFTILVFRFLQPHAFAGPSVFGMIPNPGWQDDIAEAQRLVSGDVDIPPNYQWANRVGWLFPWQNTVLWGMGIAMGLAAWGGLAWTLWMIVRGQKGWTRLAIPAAWVVVYFGWLGGNWVTTMRYFLPLYGSLAVFAGWMLIEIVKRLNPTPSPLPLQGEGIKGRGLEVPPSERSELGEGLRVGGLRRLAQIGAMLLLVFVTGYTMLYGYGMTAIYRHALTRTAVSVWFQENVPGNIGLWIEQEDGESRLQNIDTGLVSLPFYAVTLEQGEPFRTKLVTANPNDLYLDRVNPDGYPTLLVNPSEVQSVVLHRIGDPERDAGDETIRVRILRTGPSMEPEVIAERFLTSNFSEGYSDFGSEFSIRFDDMLEPTLLELRDPFTGTFANYEVEVTVIEGGAITLTRNVADNLLPIALDHVSVYLMDTLTQVQSIEGFTLDDPVKSEATAYTYYLPNIPGLQPFTARATGVIREVVIPNVGDPLHDTDAETLRVQLTGNNGEIAYGQVTNNFLMANDGFHQHGQRVSIPLDPPLRVEAGESYTLSMAADQPLTTLGTVLATEGDWDDSIPYNACPLPDDQTLSYDTASGYTNPQCNAFSPYPAYYKGVELYLAAEDDPTKLQVMLEGLDEAEYLTISSNRFYDSQSRIPYRFPLLLEYYKALFDGRLGFELVLEWTSYPRVGPFAWKDQVLPTDDLPAWMNEFESEEAFTVYDHPAVMVFRKTEQYDSEVVREILTSVPLRQYREGYGAGPIADPLPVNRNIVMAPEAAKAPTGLMMPDIVAAANARGTWRELFDPSKLINQNQGVAVITWWLLMLVMGWLTFPILYAFFPALVDRGYATSKLAGWLFVAWLAWVGGTLQFSTWSSGGILLCIGVLVALSAAFTWRHWASLGSFIRLRWQHLLALEALTLLLFVIFLGVRLGNPDLWHNSFGGEKPMNFAYFNAVLRSEVFPAYDPWFAGGYINYYYWGYVLVGAPVKLIGLTPSVAYNLIIPTLFAMTGMGAFSVAYNLVAARKTMTVPRLTPSGSPIIAGVAALLLVLVLGNLDTPRVFLNAVTQVGVTAHSEFIGGRFVPHWIAERYPDRLADFRAQMGREPDTVEIGQILTDIETGDDYSRPEQLSDQWRDFSTGLTKVMAGEPLQMHTHRWYWMPTRIIGELPDGKGHNAINEFPYFTFLYGDLHAHMIAMPVMLLALLWLLAEILSAGRNLRGWGAAAGSLFFGGLVVGLLRAINTWDLPTYMILSIAGLTFAAWIAQKTRREGVDPLPVFYRLREYLDVRRALSLWYLIWAFPVGLLLHAVIWLVRSRTYQAKLTAGLIPPQCSSLDATVLKWDQIPESCRGMLEPHWSLTSSLVWGIGAFALIGFLYLAAVIFLGARFDRRGLLAWIGRVAAFLVVSILTVMPFTFYNVGEAGLKPWEYDRTPLWAFVDIHGLFLFLLFSFLAWQTARYLKAYRVADVQGMSLPLLALLIGAPLVVIAALLIGIFAVPVMLVTLPLMAWATVLFLVPGTSSNERMIYVLIVLTMGIATGVEIVALTVDNGRQNIVFKFYMQIWLMLGVSGGVIIAWLLDAIPAWRPPLRGVWQTFLALLVSIAFLYPIMATQARWLDRFNASETPTTLDGLDYMPHAVYGQNNIWYNLIADYRMIRWLQENIEGTPTIVEAQGVEYQWSSRIAINTGLPTVIGWRFHQSQQRNVLNMGNLLWTRINNVHALYTMPDVDVAMNLIDFYDIEYIIVGTVERVLYNDLLENPQTGSLAWGLSPGLAKFDAMVELGLLEVVYEAPNCIIGSPVPPEECSPNRLVTDRIYRVVPGAEYRTQESGGG